MNTSSETLPSIQDMIWKCDKKLLLERLLAVSPRKNNRSVASIMQVLVELCNLRPSENNEVIVVPREYFLGPLVGAMVRAIDIECLDGTTHGLIRNGILGKSWEQVLSYSFWQGSEITYFDVHDAIALVIQGMIMTGSNSEYARKSALFESERANPGNSDNGDSQTCNFAQSFDWNYNNVDSFEAIKDLEQEIIHLKRLKEINELANLRFIEDAKNLSYFLKNAA